MDIILLVCGFFIVVWGLIMSWVQPDWALKFNRWFMAKLGLGKAVPSIFYSSHFGRVFGTIIAIAFGMFLFIYGRGLLE